ncbi:hypothetical protein TDB9533_02093 [Thalassocella blandensis]|nr:hypothetical protein TDB9533_02093 [Thalassocella blandensis]
MFGSNPKPTYVGDTVKKFVFSIAILALTQNAFAQFPVPDKDLDTWGFAKKKIESPRSSLSDSGATISFQAIRPVDTEAHFVLIEECYDTVEQAKQRVKNIPKLSKAAKSGGVYEKGFEIQNCVYIVNAPEVNQVTSLRYTVYPLFYAHMVGRHDFLYYVTAKSGANLRKSADSASETKTTMPVNSVVYVINESGEWKTAVTIKGSGYIHQDLVKKIYP